MNGRTALSIAEELSPEFFSIDLVQLLKEHGGK
jgi:hypothetical protein